MKLISSGGCALLGLLMTAGVALADNSSDQRISLNSERLSSLEEPIAAQAGDFTLVLSGVLDSAVLHDNDSNSTGEGITGNFQIDMLTQLSNRWRVGVSYFGQYTDENPPNAASDSDYIDNSTLSVGGSWGTVLLGNVAAVVREQTRRQRGVGNANLAFDNFLGDFDEQGASYVGRFGPWVMSSMIDDEDGYDLGATLQRPLGVRDYRLTVRTAKGDYRAPDGKLEFETKGVGLAGEYIFGSTTVDAALARERFYHTDQSIDRRYASFGIQHKRGALSLSLESHIGEFAGHRERASALGMQYDLSRGLSANFGLNYAKATVMLNTDSLVNTDETSSVASIRYSF